MLYRLTEIVHFAGRLTHMEDVMMVTKTANGEQGTGTVQHLED